MTGTQTSRQLTIASLLTETASVISTNATRDPLPSAVTLYGAMNIAVCGDPNDTRGDRGGVNSADLVRAFNSFLNVRSALDWSRAPERTHAEVVNALHACARTLREAA